MRVTIHFSADAAAELLEERCREAIPALLQEMEEDCTPYVPYDTGRLASSVRAEPAEDRAEGRLIWSAPYAASVYYGDERGVSFSGRVHPQAAGHWFSAAAAENLEKWVMDAAGTIGGRAEV